MKANLLVLGTTVAMGIGTAKAAVVAQYDMSSTSASTQGLGATATALTAASGLTIFSANSNFTPNYSTAPVLTTSYGSGAAATTTASDAFTANRFFSFSVTVGSTDLSLTTLTLDGARGGSGTPRGYGVRVTTPTTTNELVQDTTPFTTARPNFSLSPYSTDLSGFASLQNLTSGQTVKFDIAVYTTGGTASVEFDNITLNSVPEPSVALLGAFGALALLRRRR